MTKNKQFIPMPKKLEPVVELLIVILAITLLAYFISFPNAR